MTNRKLVKQIIHGYNHGQVHGTVIYRRPYTYVRHMEAQRYTVTVFQRFVGLTNGRQRGYDIALAKAARDVVSQLSSVELDGHDIAPNASEVLQYDDIPF